MKAFPASGKGTCFSREWRSVLKNPHSNDYAWWDLVYIVIFLTGPPLNLPRLNLFGVAGTAYGHFWSNRIIFRGPRASRSQFWGQEGPKCSTMFNQCSTHICVGVAGTAHHGHFWSIKCHKMAKNLFIGPPPSPFLEMFPKKHWGSYPIWTWIEKNKTSKFPL